MSQLYEKKTKSKSHSETKQLLIADFAPGGQLTISFVEQNLVGISSVMLVESYRRL